MKNKLQSLIILSLLSSCASKPLIVKSNGDKIWLGGGILNREKDVNVTVEDSGSGYTLSYSAAENDSTEVAKLGIKSYTTLRATEILSGAYKSITNTKTAASVSNNAANQVTKQAAIGADVEKTRILNPVEEVIPTQ